jgi:hypothetical protein
VLLQPRPPLSALAPPLLLLLLLLLLLPRSR